ncbi:MAG: DUF4956 domain-containing protein [Muribaculaceae bacterium]|nr:DUF4956 domain-containing protein [Muribaculaceae bacterium]
MNTDFSSLLAQLFSSGQFGHISVANFLLNTVVVWIMVHFLYFRKSQRRDFYFTFMLISILIYFLVYFMIFVLEDLKGKTGIGIGIGLFGIFSIMRYRTDAMPVREMTYLFSVICLAVINALGSEISLMELLLPNVVIFVAVLLCELFLLARHEQSKLVQYDRVALIVPEKRDELIADLRERLGLDVTRVDVGAVDFLRDTAILRVYYPMGEKQENVDEEIDTLKMKKAQWEEVKTS